MVPAARGPDVNDDRAIRRWLVISDMAAQHARNMYRALEHVLSELEILDGYPTQTIGASDPTSEPRTEACRVCHGRGCDQCAALKYTATERAAHLRYNLLAQREQMRDDLATIEELMSSAGEVINRTLRGRVPRPATAHRLCEPTGHEGCLVPITEGGWADYTCTDLAEKAGLCNRHYMAKRRWLIRNGLPTRSDEAA